MYSKEQFLYDSVVQRESTWEPIPLHLPVPEMGYWPEPEESSRDEEEQESSHGVLIIDMNDYTEVMF